MPYKDPEVRRARAREYSAKHYLANKETKKEKHRAWATSNPEKMREYVAKWKAANPEVPKAYYEANRERILHRQRELHAAHPERGRAKRAKRRAAEMQRTPPWADLDAIKAVYLEAQRYADLGLEVHVDHFYPLRGKTVSGLHVHNNLFVILADDNQRKFNKHPDEIEH